MGPINYTAVVLGAVAFFAVGAIWYTVLFGKAWAREAKLTEDQITESSMAKLFGLAFLAELVISWMFGHMLARIQPPAHVIWMMAFGFGATIMTPAIAINYLFLRRSMKLFLMDAGHLIAGSLAMGSVFIVLG